MFYHYLFGMILSLVLMDLSLFSTPLSISVNAESAILINAETGAVLYEKNAKKAQFPASTTKVATAAYALKVGSDKLDNLVVAEQDALAMVTEEARRRSNYTIAPYWLVPGGSHIGIKKGEELSLKDLLHGMMIASGNDAANVIAHYLGGSVPNYIEGLNGYLKEIGCQNTTFYNPHGLHHPDHKTTAYDLALITREAFKHPLFRQIVSTVRYTRPKTNKQEATTLVQTNRLLKNGRYYYAKATGVKTGYTATALHSLVASAKQDERTLIAVLLRSKEREDVFLDAVKMFETAFKESKIQRTLLKGGEQRFVLDLPGASKAMKTYLLADVTFEYYPAEEPDIKCFLHWKEGITVPIAKDQEVGKLCFQTKEGVLVQTVSLLSQEEIKSTWIYSMKQFFTKNQNSDSSSTWKLMVGIVICLLLGGFVIGFGCKVLLNKK